MGIFTRFRDIVNSNINSMLDKSEDPEKLIRMMIHEMEDTLVELKASCAGLMAEHRRTEQRLGEAKARIAKWEGNAALAVSRNRDDLAREALTEKRKHAEKAASLERELEEHVSIMSDYRNDIARLEEKLNNAREKQRTMLHRSIHLKTVPNVRRAGSAEAMFKYGDLQGRVDRMEADDVFVSSGRERSLEEELEFLAMDEEIEQELIKLKDSQAEANENQP